MQPFAQFLSALLRRRCRDCAARQCSTRHHSNAVLLPWLSLALGMICIIIFMAVMPVALPASMNHSHLQPCWLSLCRASPLSSTLLLIRPCWTSVFRAALLPAVPLLRLPRSCSVFRADSQSSCSVVTTGEGIDSMSRSPHIISHVSSHSGSIHCAPRTSDIRTGTLSAPAACTYRMLLHGRPDGPPQALHTR